jgi:nucleoside-diphosphate-sugar epimerase
VRDGLRAFKHERPSDAARVTSTPPCRRAMKVLVTGHHGYLGSVVAPAIAAAGHDVTGVDTFFYEGCDFVDESRAVTALRADVRDLSAGELEGYDAIVHLAALSNDPLGALNAELTLDINFRATVELARKAKDAGVGRFVFASSCSMYGETAGGEHVTEEAPLRPLTAYAESKVRSEEGLAELADAGFAPVFMRNATVYGVSPRLRFDVVLNNLAGWAYTTKRVRIMSDGTPWRPIVHVRDVADATITMLTAPADVVRAEAFNVGADSENYQVRDLAEIVRVTFAGCDVEYAEGAGPDPRSYRVSFGKLERTFPEFQTTWNAADGARELRTAFEQVNLNEAEFAGHKFTRLAHLKLLADSGRIDETLRWVQAARPTAV